MKLNAKEMLQQCKTSDERLALIYLLDENTSLEKVENKVEVFRFTAQQHDWLYATKGNLWYACLDVPCINPFIKVFCKLTEVSDLGVWDVFDWRYKTCFALESGNLLAFEQDRASANEGSDWALENGLFVPVTVEQLQKLNADLDKYLSARRRAKSIGNCFIHKSA